MPKPRSVRALLDTVEHIYATVEAEERWNDALRSIAQLLDARAAGIRIEVPEVGVEQRFVGLEESFERAYVDFYWQSDPWVEPGRTSIELGRAAFGDELVPRRVVEASAFHAELALPSGFDDLAGAVLQRSPSKLVTIGVMKGLGTRRFTKQDAELLTQLLPHLRRALAWSERLAGKRGGGSRTAEVEEILVERYRLTDAELRVALRISGGACPKEVAGQLGVSWNTVRAQLRAIYAKTETGSQRELTRLVLRLEREAAWRTSSSLRE